MFSEDDLLPISALQHLLYCERQCALIHTERLWAENRFTVEGRHLHERADSSKRESRGGLRSSRSVPLWSFKLGLFGKADVVEFHAACPEPACCEPIEPVEGARPEVESGGRGEGVTGGPGAPSFNIQQSAFSNVPHMPFPVEYKRGKPKSHDADRVQLCAQAMCLEEMLGVAVPAGALFYGRTRRRMDVAFDPAIRDLTRLTARRLHEMLASGQTPPAVYEKKKCERCSLKTQCLPRLPAGRAARFLEREVGHLLSAAGPASD
jgi:CRISPR-associated exonuclease Cas4